MHYEFFSLDFSAIALLLPLFFNYENSNSFSGNSIHLNREFLIRAFSSLGSPHYHFSLTPLPTLSGLPPPYSIHSELC